ncbi:hypothetical protein LTR50_003527 [Elasticomyces elasticus]|nr:hypothetical protein LTR50_003527 [Elasticomyces elasticus]
MSAILIKEGPLRGFSLWKYFLLLMHVWTGYHLVKRTTGDYHGALPTFVFLFCWLLRITVNDPYWTLDTCLLAGVAALLERPWRYLPEVTHGIRDATRSVPISVPVRVVGVLGLIMGVSYAIARRGNYLRNYENETGTASSLGNFLRPLIIPSRTTHTRFVPKKHSFSYSYLYVGVPIGWTGCAGSFLSADTHTLPKHQQRKGWLDVSAANYLERGGAGLTLKEKLDQYLHSQGLNQADYAFAYLVTAPSFLGHSFNPVSFWYLYDEDRRLKMMILEVNNTFDERRMYLLRPDTPRDSQNATIGNSHAAGGAKNTDASRAKTFTETWPKDFHVSPFNSRKGTYNLSAQDPLASFGIKDRMIDNTIVLRTSKNEAKLVARVFSEGAPIDPAGDSALRLFRFVLGWWWVGLVTFPRIVREAGKLYFKRSLYVWFRPEVVLGSIGRKATVLECTLETFFRRYLECLVKQSEYALGVHYSPARGLGDQVKMHSLLVGQDDTSVKILEVNVLTPAFYDRFIHYAHLAEAFDRESLCTDEGNRTVLISDPSMLYSLIQDGRKNTLATFHNIHYRHGFMEDLNWALLRSLRCPPIQPSYGTQQQPTLSSMKDIRKLPFSPVDLFVRMHCVDSADYRRVVTKLFLAQRLAFGFPELVTAADILTRLVMAWVMWQCLKTAPSGTAKVWMGCLGVSATHGWALLKG